MLTKIYVPEYMYDYENIASKVSQLAEAGHTILDETNKTDAEHILYKDFYKDIEIHRNLYAYRAPQLIYYNNRFVFNTMIRNFYRRITTANIYNLPTTIELTKPKTLFAISRLEIENFVSDASIQYRLINSYQNFEDSLILNGAEILSTFTDEMIQTNIDNRGKVSTKAENICWLIEEVNDLNVELKTIQGIRTYDDNGIESISFVGLDYQENEKNIIYAFGNSLGVAAKHPYTMSYYYNGNSINIVNFRFEVDENFPQLELVF